MHCVELIEIRRSALCNDERDSVARVHCVLFRETLPCMVDLYPCALIDDTNHISSYTVVRYMVSSTRAHGYK